MSQPADRPATGAGLVAVLLNPPARSSGIRSRNAVSRAASALGHDQVRVVNLCVTPTPSVVELGTVSYEGWASARDDLGSALEGSSAVLAGWGIAGISAPARPLLLAQLDWFTQKARGAGHQHLWMVGGEPRHPSRWHQYVSDKYGRTSGGSFEERLHQVLVAVPIERARR